MLTAPLFAILGARYGSGGFPNWQLIPIAFIFAFSISIDWQFALIWTIGYAAFRMPATSGNGFRIWLPSAAWRLTTSDLWMVKLVMQYFDNNAAHYWLIRPFSIWLIYIAACIYTGNYHMIALTPLCIFIGFGYIVCPALKWEPRAAEYLASAMIGLMVWLSWGAA